MKKKLPIMWSGPKDINVLYLMILKSIMVKLYYTIPARMNSISSQKTKSNCALRLNSNAFKRTNTREYLL